MRVDATVDVPMGTADEQIRVSDRVKDRLDRRRREGESYNDVLERLLADSTGRQLGAPVVSADRDLTHDVTKQVVDVEEY